MQSVLNNIESKKQDFESYIQSKDQEIEELDEQKEHLISEVEEQNQLLIDAKSQIADKSIEIKSLEDRVIVLNQEDIKKKNAVEVLQKNYNDLTNKYLALQKNVNLLPDTLDGFSQRSFKNKRSYLVLSAVPLIVLGFIVYGLGSNKRVSNKISCWKL